jgi:predicted ABC-type transport system involved in lysophospholipase L1 biosynthesis ATPase subunit
MATDDPTTILDTETLTAIAIRLYDRAEEIQQIALADLNHDLRLAAQVCTRLADVRLRIAEIAANALVHPNWDRAAFARDLRELIDKD